ncbi:unnamed protein product [Caenorhabditis auriculariae]|uniref:Isoleucine--tRNA ligase, cytoplasmic n=1 Tax=Caenorhabditis auriculariae TaxID=2777116 RepID=A0A8S1H6B0_9PELO|nr:unnamed protein product [Caenorhabditis auriculariae]
MAKLSTVPDQINFADEEAKILKKWKDEDTFQKSVALSKDRPHFTFFDGPPFATGLPHYGHILAGTIKDVVTRWAHQNGHCVQRRFGWDTHGLPVEHEVDKSLGIKGPQDVYEMGIGTYNQHCRSIVMRYSAEWEESVNRMGRWIDFRNDYKTLYPTFMESVWWAFSELVKKGLVYRGVKVMPFSTACSTPLSNFEAGQNYKDVVDPSAFVGFKQEGHENRYLVAWTTTPWTLPSNLALCVHPELQYLVAKDKTTGKEYVVMEDRLFELKNENLEVVEKMTGKQLEGVKYEPLFPYFKHLREQTGAFRVLNNTFVTTDTGTGIVHQAPYFGEIDYQVCKENEIITKDMVVCPVDEKGLYTKEVPDYAGLYVKDADKLILKHLKETGHLVRQSDCKHSYPFCWRSDTPLLYKAVPSWFIRVESIVPLLLANNEQTYWVPAFVKEKRFANWLRDARDWAVSRNRFWGTPINLWVSDDLEEVVAPSSIAELEELTGHKITDIHRESIDHLTIPSKTGRGVLRRVPEVFDCWFESGSMPYAQNHYPFENRKIFEENFPADFIAEGIDQTRGWFYTLLVLSTALFNKPPWKNLICNGLVLAPDGSKMSKRKKNYPDPMEIVHKYGADALRLYLINSPVVRGENLRFREEGVRDLLKDVFLPWFNAYRFFVQNVQLYEHDTQQQFVMPQEVKSENVMDRWIESFTNSLVGFVRKEMNAYRLYAVVSPLTRYFDTLTNIYIRLNRKRIKGDSGVEDQLHALAALGRVLVLIVRLMAPFTPFFSEYIWQNLRKVTGAKEESVHFAMIPEANESLIDENVERRVEAMRNVIDLVRLVRDREGIAVKYPLKEMIVINRNSQYLEDIESLKHYVLLELNVRKLTVSQDKNKYGITLKADPNFKLLGARLKGEQKKVADYLKNKITEAELEQFLAEGKLTVLGHELTSEEVAVSYANNTSAPGEHGYQTHSDAKTIVMVDTSEDESLVEEGLCREVTNRVQRLRKQAKLISTDSASVHIVVQPADSLVGQVLTARKAEIEAATGTPITIGAPTKTATATSKSAIKDAEVELWLFSDTDSSFEGVTVFNGSKKIRIPLKTSNGTLEKYHDLLYNVRSAFDLWNGKISLKDESDALVHPTVEISSLAGRKLTVS